MSDPLDWLTSDVPRDQYRLARDGSTLIRSHEARYRVNNSTYKLTVFERTEAVTPFAWTVYSVTRDAVVATGNAHTRAQAALMATVSAEVDEASLHHHAFPLMTHALMRTHLN